MRTLTGHDTFVVTARFDNTGKRVLSSSGDGTARLWDVGTGDEIVRFQGYADMVINATFSTDHTRVLTYSWDSTAKVWDLEGRELLTVNLRDGAVYGEWSPDGRTIALCGRNGAVRLLRAVLWEDLKEMGGVRVDLEAEVARWVERVESGGAPGS